MYNPEHQYRCTIIRGKAKTDLDNLLPLYASIIEELTPCSNEVFIKEFEEKLKKFMPTAEDKTLHNHRTEIAGKLFGLYQKAENDEVLETERCRKYLTDNDQPAFFKEMCYKIQFPNGMDSVATIKDRVSMNIAVRPECYVVTLLAEAKKAGMSLTMDDIAYYALNNLDVLQGGVKPAEVITKIKEDRKRNHFPEVSTPGKAPSFNMQHIREQIVYLELANLVYVNKTGYVSKEYVYLNSKEEATIKSFVEAIDQPLPFDIYSYDLDDVESTKALRRDWDEYYGRLSASASNFTTSANALQKDVDENGNPIPAVPVNTTELGDEGEQIVVDYEKERVGSFDRHLLNRIIAVGKVQGLGYDVMSVMANGRSEGDLAKYIEVKTTKRVTEPNLDDPMFSDSINITRNEWIAAKQNGKYFSFYRIYILPDKVMFLIIDDPYKKVDDGTLTLVPLTYRIDFSKASLNQNFTRLKHENA